jgi:methionyl aminopeptidase
MSVSIKTEEEIELMRHAGKLLARLHVQLHKELHAGMSTKKIDKICEEIIRSYGCKPSFLNYDGFPASICVSLNDVVVHGIPSKHEYLEEGDIVSLDTGLIYKGYHADAARTWGIGEISDDVAKLVRETRECFFRGIAKAVVGGHVNDIGREVEDYAHSHGYGVVRDLVGHGIGTHLHEEPEVPNFRTKRRGMKLQAGMTIAVEPMINMGTWEVDFLDDEWTVLTADGLPSAHYENTILITDDGPEILTLEKDENGTYIE